MIKRSVLFPLVIILLLPLSGPAHPQAGGDPGYGLQVLQMDETGVILELRLTGFALAERQHQGAVYQTVTAPGLAPMTEPGKPRVPSLGTLVGTPSGGIAEIKILETESETRTGLRLLPTPALAFSETGEEIEVLAPDQALYARDAAFPGPLAQVGLTGRLRDQPVAQVRLYPFQYNPLRQELVVYRRLRVQLVFAPSVRLQANLSVPRPDTPYERMLASALLNYNHLPPASPAPRQVERPAALALSQAPALKVLVDKDGLYRITYDDLQNAGFNLHGVSPRHLRLGNRGREVAIFISGEADGVFNPGDWLEFYGMATVSEFTTRNVYWLTVGDGPGLRMVERDGTPTGAGATPTSFYTLLHVEKDYTYWAQSPLDVRHDHWFWMRFPSAPYSQGFYFDVGSRADISTDSLVRVALVGRTDTGENPDHHTQVLLNGRLISEAWWDGQTIYTHEVTISQQSLQNGYNTLTVKTPGDTGAAVDGIYFNWFDVGYWNTFDARDDQLYFVAPQTGQTMFTLDNFDDDALSVYDIGDPYQVARLANARVEAQEGKYRLRVQDDVSPGARYLALADHHKRSPAGLLLDSPSHLRSPDNGADYVIITHEDFNDAVVPLARYRANQGLRVATVSVTDIYDEFGDGIFDPQAIRDFLSYAYHNWTPPAPLYVLLVGDANYDYKDNYNTDQPNYVPVHLFESSLIGQTSTDNWFVSVSGDDPLPDMFIGRFPVTTPVQAELLVTKTLAYEQDPPPGNWQQSALFIADDGSDIFDVISDELVALLPRNYTTQRMYAEFYPSSYDPSPGVVAAIDQGQAIVNYVGHGSVTSWGDWPGGIIFEAGDVEQLNNGSIYPFLVIGNCSSGMFAAANQEALAEVFIRHDKGGGIAAFSPTGREYTSWHEAVLSALYTAIFDSYTYPLGPATTAARIATFAQTGRSEPVESFALLGDPALALKVVQPRLNLSKTATVSQVRPGQLLTYTLAYANTGSIQVEDVVLTETLDPGTVYYASSLPPAHGDNVWQLGSLPVGASGAMTIVVRVSKTALPGSMLVNTAVIGGNGTSSKIATARTFVNPVEIYLPLIQK